MCWFCGEILAETYTYPLFLTTATVTIFNQAFYPVCHAKILSDIAHWIGNWMYFRESILRNLPLWGKGVRESIEEIECFQYPKILVSLCLRHTRFQYFPWACGQPCTQCAQEWLRFQKWWNRLYFLASIILNLPYNRNLHNLWCRPYKMSSAH